MIGLTDRELAKRAALEGQRRASFITALTDIAVYYETHDGAPIPDCKTLGFRIRGEDDSEREAAVNAVAEALGVHGQWKNGVYIAARQFGPLTIEAHYTPAVAKQEIARHALYGKPVAA
jgi:hypothetical protein